MRTDCFTISRTSGLALKDQTNTDLIIRETAPSFWASAIALRPALS